MCIRDRTSAGSEWSPQVKQAATMIKENPAKASEAFDELLKGKNKKNTSLLVEIGRAYLDQGKTAEAAEYAQRAKDVNSKCAVAYLLSGDCLLYTSIPCLSPTLYSQGNSRY